MFKNSNPNSIGYRKPKFLYTDDPRAIDSVTFENFRSNAGAEVILKPVATNFIELEEYVEPLLWISAMNTEGSVPRSATVSGDYLFIVLENGTIIKYDNVGNVVWQKQLTGHTFTIYDVKIDSSGNIYIAGSTLAFPQKGYLIKLNSSGSLQWSKTTAISGNNMVFNNIEIDSSGNVYTVGLNSIIKFDTSGTALWEKSYFIDGATDFYVQLSGMKKTASGDIVLNGVYTDTSDSQQYKIIIKIDNSGTIIWHKIFSVVSSGYISYSNIQIDSSGYIYVSYLGGPYDTNIFTKLSSTGEVIYSYDIYGNDNGIDGNTFAMSTIASLAIDDSNNVYLVGDTDVPTEYGNQDMGIIKFNTSGSSVIQKIFGSSVNNYRSIAISGSNNTIFLVVYSETALYDEEFNYLGSTYKNIVSLTKNDFSNSNGPFTVDDQQVHFANITPTINLPSSGLTVSSSTLGSSIPTLTYETDSSTSVSSSTYTYTTGTF